ncbi:hypothetical protein [Cohnella abietis]|uniref:HNH endonuclease n=1 Tax=Cohnella abietis TaxID=2507935 RepID=A0A3T1D1T3_9BACL|nr:hypothetical protein [Cohnella abietis]BBI32011.1 hypothetical protein KCTCHS21_14100 [Cohnella abietis]
MFIPIGDFIPAPKPEFKRGKLSRRQRSELSAKEVKRLRERSDGVCEKCDSQRTSGKAHLERRWRSEEKPTAEDVVDLCTDCHKWADGTPEGRRWFEEKKQQLRMEAII